MTADQTKPLVLVTGATGYIAGHCIRELMENGYRVRGTVPRWLPKHHRADHHRHRSLRGLEAEQAGSNSDQRPVPARRAATTAAAVRFVTWRRQPFPFPVRNAARRSRQRC